MDEMRSSGGATTAAIVIDPLRGPNDDRVLLY